MFKSDIFSVTAKCPVCNSSFGMCVSDIPDRAYHCTECGEDFRSAECKDSAGDFWEINIIGISTGWVDKNTDTLSRIRSRYGADYYACDDSDPGMVTVEFGWLEPLSDELVAGITDEIMAILPQGAMCDHYSSIPLADTLIIAEE